MSCIRIPISPNVSAIGSAGSMDLAATTPRCPANIRLKPSFNVIRAAQVSAADYQTAPAIEAGGHMRNSGTMYEVLGLSRGATAQDIKRAHRKMARQFHPDTIAASCQGKNISTQMFLQIHNAYAVLSKAEDRAQYDRQLEMQQRVPTWGAYREPCGHMVRNWETDQCW